jgi:hypothetical protein
MCSKPLKRGAQTCFACGFSSDAPSVWIDPTVHAYQHIMPQSTTRDLTPDPQAASPVWQYESPHFEAAGSLPMLSLFMPETPTQPQPPVPNRATTRRLPRIDEIDTVPPQATPARDIDQADTLPPGHAQGQRALIIAPQNAPVEIGSHSWTAGTASGSPSAQLIVRSSRRKRVQGVDMFNPLDRTRWWLLRPGRIEFILWLGGTLLLIGVTCLLLLVFALSFQWIMPFVPANPLATSANSSNAQQHRILPPGAGPSLALLYTNPLVPGQSFQLSGQGFKPSIMIAFYFDGKSPLLNQSNQTAWVRTDGHGTFESRLWLGTGSVWSPGEHIIAVRDASGAPLTAIRIRLAASSTNSTVASSSPVPTSTPGGTHTGTPTPTGPQSTPVSHPPVTVTPTKPPVTPTPSPTQARPTVTPTVATSPTITPTAKTSPTPVTTPAGATPTAGVSPTAANTGLGNALNDSGVPPAAARLASVSPLVWIMVACYLLSMVALGAAGIIHRRHDKIVI